MLLFGYYLLNYWIWRYCLGKLRCEWSANRRKKKKMKQSGKRTVIDEEADLRKWFCLLVLCLASSEWQSSLQSGLLRSWVWTFSVEFSFFCSMFFDVARGPPSSTWPPVFLHLADKVCLATLPMVFCFYKKGWGGCKIQVGDLVMELKSKA